MVWLGDPCPHAKGDVDCKNDLANDKRGVKPKVLFKSNAVWHQEEDVGAGSKHDGVLHVKEIAKWHDYEVVEATVLLGQPKLSLYFVVLESLRVWHRVKSEERNIFFIVTC